MISKIGCQGDQSGFSKSQPNRIFQNLYSCPISKKNGIKKNIFTNWDYNPEKDLISTMILFIMLTIIPGIRLCRTELAPETAK